MFAHAMKTNSNSLFTSIALACVVVAFAATLQGCGRSTKVQATTTTVGQELQDLDAARNKGLLTEKEYNDKRKEIMKRD